MHVVVGEEGVEVHKPKQAPALHALWKRPPGGFPSRDVLAVLSREPLRAWVGTAGQTRRLLFGEEARTEARIEAYVLDAISTSDGRVLACLAPSGERRARLVVMNADAADPDTAEELRIPKPTRIEWPGGIWSKGASWPEDEAEDDDEPLVLDALAMGHPQPDERFAFDEVTCSANEHGFAVAGAYSGLVVAVSPDASRVDFALRVPTQQGDTEIFAARTAEGVVVVLCIDGKHAAIVHLAPDGRVIAHRHKSGREQLWGMGPPVVQGDRVVVFEAGVEGESRLHDMALSDLKIVKSGEVGMQAKGRVSTWSAPGQNVFLLGLGAAACRVKRDGRGRISCEALERPAAPERAPRPKVPAGPPLADGPPSLALAKSNGPRSWETSVGAKLGVTIAFTNQGGKSRGVAVEVGGPALQAGLVVPRRVRVGEQEAELVAKGGAARAEFGSIDLPAGYAQGTKKGIPLPEPMTFVAEVEFDGAKAGSSVLTVRVSPLGAAPGRGSVLQGKSVTVRG